MSTKSILEKWNAQGCFVRFLDGNKGNCALRNLEYVHIKDAIEHFGEWTFDWDMDLTRAEKRLVADPGWRAGLNFREKADPI